MKNSTELNGMMMTMIEQWEIQVISRRETPMNGCVEIL